MSQGERYELLLPLGMARDPQPISLREVSKLQTRGKCRPCCLYWSHRITG